jgi:hypothetical protein
MLTNAVARSESTLIQVLWFSDNLPSRDGLVQDPKRNFRYIQRYAAAASLK